MFKVVSITYDSVVPIVPSIEYSNSILMEHKSRVEMRYLLSRATVERTRRQDTYRSMSRCSLICEIHT